LQKVLGTAATASAVYKNLGSPNLSYINPFSSSFLGGAFNSSPNMGTIDTNMQPFGQQSFNGIVYD
jgi:hypothetical protein